MSIDKHKILIELGARIRKIREEKGLSLREVAARCDVDHSNIGKIERGEYDLRFTTLYQIALAMEVKIEKLLPLD